MISETGKFNLKVTRTWIQKVNSKKLYWVTSGVFFALYFYINQSSLSVIQNFFVSAVGAALTPVLLAYVFLSIGLFLAMIWLLIAPFFKWFSRWITK
jgi:hypothetical protein